LAKECLIVFFAIFHSSVHFSATFSQTGHLVPIKIDHVLLIQTGHLVPGQIDHLGYPIKTSAFSGQDQDSKLHIIILD
jgi:hypothetical protein